MKSVLQAKKECFVCKTTYGLHDHHIFGGNANRPLSEKRGMKIWLCYYHHNGSNEGIHFNKAFNKKIKKMAQEYYEEHYGTRDEFRQEFGKSYL